MLPLVVYFARVFPPRLDENDMCAEADMTADVVAVSTSLAMTGERGSTCIPGTNCKQSSSSSGTDGDERNSCMHACSSCMQSVKKQ